jgi:hypothetical protein
MSKQTLAMIISDLPQCTLVTSADCPAECQHLTMSVIMPWLYGSREEHKIFS